MEGNWQYFGVGCQADDIVKAMQTAPSFKSEAI